MIEGLRGKYPLPDILAVAAAQKAERWADAAGELPDPQLHALAGHVFACSDFVAAQCLRHPALPAESAQAPAIATAFESLDIGEDENAFMGELRRLRNRLMAQIAWRDLVGSAGLRETLSATSRLAEACIGAALRQATAKIESRHGQLYDSSGDVQELIVIAMGKLGGGELNFSSDIDLVFLYPESGTSDGGRPLGSDRYFARIAQHLIRILNQPTGDGFVFRVDTRLRPFGTTGALALSFAAFETYLQQHGREWERYAYVKARALNGRDDCRQQFAALVRPFVYRRYLDFGVIESLREMHALIAADVNSRDRHNDVKLGPGGIREIEFIAQSFQLLRGGADPDLRNPSLLAVLPRLAEQRWLEGPVAGELVDAYFFLRQVENRLQFWRDEQVHRLPEDETGRARVAHAMGLESWDALAATLEQVRATVTRHFESVVPVTRDPGHTDVIKALWTGDPGSDAAGERLAELGFAHPAVVKRQLKTLHDSSQYRHLDRRGRKRLDELIPKILRLAGRQDQADAVVSQLLNIIAAVGRRSAYFALLNENTAVLERLATLCAASPWIARRVAQHPILLDELIDPRIFETPPTRADLASELQQRFDGVEDDDLERQMEALRLFQQASVFRVAVSDLSGALPLMKVSDRLTDIAELVLARTVELAAGEMRRRYGRPGCGPGEVRREAGFAVVGYGKLGGLELGYASDLDLVLLHDSEGENQCSDGPDALDNVRYFARLGQRLLHMLSTTTAAGVLYEVDMRLRPSGKGGPLVSSVNAFEHYQQQSAWTWEHQALLRARALAGSDAVCGRFETIRRAVLTASRDPATLRKDVLEMRDRMRRELRGGGPGQFDIKRDPGGLTDIEFMVQYRVLAGAAGHPELVRYSDNIRQLEALADADILDAGIAAEMTDIYRRFRQRLHRLALADAPGVVPAEEFSRERARVIERWAGLFGD